jgi:hypothetical protein
MNITTSHLPAFCRQLEAALTDSKIWVCYDANIQQLSAYDLHFFMFPGQAADFQLLGPIYDKEISLLPTDALLQYLRDKHDQLLREGKQFSQIPFDDEQVLAYQYEFRFNLAANELTDLMDAYDWRQVHYDPMEANTEAETIADKQQFLQLEFLLEQLSRFSLKGIKESAFVVALVDRHWTGQSMEVYIPQIVRGKFQQRQINHSHKTENMTQENLEYLQKQLRFADFGEGLFPQLEKAMQEGKESFQLKTSHEFGKDRMDAVLHFAKSKQQEKDMYFFNKYDATLVAQNLSVSQTFFINNKGRSIGLQGACNLLNGRSLYMEVTPKEGVPYKAWLQLNFSERDEQEQAKVQYFNQNYGFDLKEAVGRLPLKEFSNPESMEKLYSSLQRGDLTSATLLKGGNEIAVQITADPKYKTVKMFDMEGSKLFVPGAKQETKHGQAPVDAKRDAEGHALHVGDSLNGKSVADGSGQGAKQNGEADQEVKNNKKKDLLPKRVNNNNLLPKNRVKQGKGQGIA